VAVLTTFRTLGLKKLTRWVWWVRDIFLFCIKTYGACLWIEFSSKHTAVWVYIWLSWNTLKLCVPEGLRLVMTVSVYFTVCVCIMESVCMLVSCCSHVCWLTALRSVFSRELSPVLSRCALSWIKYRVWLAILLLQGCILPADPPQWKEPRVCIIHTTHMH